MKGSRDRNTRLLLEILIEGLGYFTTPVNGRSAPTAEGGGGAPEPYGSG